MARIEIPAIGVDEIVVSGVRPNDLQKGPGHFPRTPMPGQLGNAAIAGHRTTYGSPFRQVDKLQPGDEIVVRTAQGGFVYLVTGTEIVSPQDSHVVSTIDPDTANLTLVSCHPVFSAAQRIIVYAEMDLTRSIPFPAEIADDAGDEPAELPSEELPGDDAADASSDDASGEADEPEEGADDEGDEGADSSGDTPATDGDTADTDDAAGIEVGGADGGTDDAAAIVTTPDVDSELDEAFGRGWFHDRDAFGQIALWGALLTFVSIGSYLLSRVTRRDLVGFTIGVAPFAVGAFFFFQNVNRLLPPGL